MSEITVTLALTITGQSESIAVAADSTTLHELADFAKALLGVDNGDVMALFKDGRRLVPPSLSLQQAGLVHGDVIAVEVVNDGMSLPSDSTAAATLPSVGGGLDFSNLLAAVAPPTSSATSSTTPLPPAARYVPGMNLADAMDYNPHPQDIVALLRSHNHLMKELNYHNPTLAQKLQLTTSLEDAVKIWREDLVKSGIQGALQQTKQYQEENKWKTRLAQNPDDDEAKAYFSEHERIKQVIDQYRQVMQEYPESTVGQILMLYVSAKINDHPILAFVDSGAQQTIMSQKCAERCGLLPWVDKRFSGTAIGVGRGKILGRLHVVQLQIGPTYFPCSITVMEDSGLGDQNMEFLLG
jgi:cell fate (sporulation/competence/biofilm development) regulator YlbF (YheA/YmcA/DUF963 family)